MRIPDNIRRCVVFLGYSDGKGGFTAAGTGFFVRHKKHGYLITAQHIARAIGDDPFAIRVNKHDGNSDNILIDPLEDKFRWFTTTDDPNVDLAIAPFDYDLSRMGCNNLFFPTEHFAVKAKREEWNIGVGDVCYAIGLFRLFAGTARNLPVVHTGNIALMPEDELIPVQDWLANKGSGKMRHVAAYLLEMQNLKGLSGSPVFVRASVDFEGSPAFIGRMLNRDLLMIGLWQSSWDAPPGEVMAIEHGESVRIPAGMGVVVPADKILALLDIEELEDLRQRADAAQEHHSAAAIDGQQEEGG